ncbi:MAG: 2-oxoacid:acceptor oxidoreductase subunit alpha [Candidatus Didemnitutus sp.]|nr:2-oxoacid:acceptor oxidoreductase subunit alpha [Candidatus Didemnitutus sp.]
MVSPNSSTPGPEAGTAPATPVPTTTIPDVVIRLAGNSQDGIQSVGGFLARLAGRSDQDVMTYMTIPATISGGPSIFQVRMGTGDILSAGDQADFLVAFYQHSYESHIAALRPGGVLIYDSDHVKPNPEDRRFTHVGLPITSATVEAVGGTGKDKGKNIYVLGLIARIFDLDVPKLSALIAERLGGRGEEAVRNAMTAFNAGYANPVENLLGHLYRFARVTSEGKTASRPVVTMDGNSAMVYGLLTAGVRYGAAYPITPWSSIMEMLRTELPKYGGLFIQAEDEIAAIAHALGFAYSGHLSVTGSSGPGLSLKMEALGWAGMAEIPLVCINVQRGGPSTGLPTSVEQSDLMQAIYGSHGDSPRVVLAPKNVEDCFYIALEAVRIARDFSTPVIVLTDQALATRIEAFEEPDLKALVKEHVLDLSPRPVDYKPYPIDGATRHAPPGSRMLSGKYPVVTGLEHDEFGHSSASPATHVKMNARRREKIKAVAATLPAPEVYGDQQGDVLVVGWGSTFGPIREAVNQMRQTDGGPKVGHVHLRSLSPLEPGLAAIFARYRKVVVVEINDEGLYGYGQLASVLRGAFADPKIQSLCKTDGLTYKVREIVAGVQKHLQA